MACVIKDEQCSSLYAVHFRERVIHGTGPRGRGGGSFSRGDGTFRRDTSNVYFRRQFHSFTSFFLFLSLTYHAELLNLRPVILRSAILRSAFRVPVCVPFAFHFGTFAFRFGTFAFRLERKYYFERAKRAVGHAFQSTTDLPSCAKR